MPEFYRAEIPIGIFYIPINISASGTIINGILGKQIIVLSASLVCNGAVNATFQTSTGLLDIGGPYYCAQNGGIVLPHNVGGWFKTALGDSLVLALSSPVAVGGSLSYIAA